MTSVKYKTKMIMAAGTTNESAQEIRTHILPVQHMHHAQAGESSTSQRSTQSTGLRQQQQHIFGKFG